MKKKDWVLVMLCFCVLILQMRVNWQSDLLDNYEDLTSECIETTETVIKQRDYWMECYFECKSLENE